MMDTGKQLSTISNSLSRAIAAESNGPGRPLVYDRAHCQAEIVTRLMAAESLAGICRDPAMPCARTVNAWASADADFAAKMKDAKEIGIYTLADACYEIARGDGPHATGSIERDKLLVSVIKWLVEKREGRSLSLYHAPITIHYNDLDDQML